MRISACQAPERLSSRPSALQDRLVVSRQPDRLGDASCSRLRTLGALDPPQRGPLRRGSETVVVVLRLRGVGQSLSEVLWYTERVDILKCRPGSVLLCCGDGAQAGLRHQALCCEGLDSGLVGPSPRAATAAGSEHHGKPKVVQRAE